MILLINYFKSKRSFQNDFRELKQVFRLRRYSNGGASSAVQPKRIDGCLKKSLTSCIKTSYLRRKVQKKQRESQIT